MKNVNGLLAIIVIWLGGVAIGVYGQEVEIGMKAIEWKTGGSQLEAIRSHISATRRFR